MRSWWDTEATGGAGKEVDNEIQDGNGQQVGR
jgi:hypothetical protein